MWRPARSACFSPGALRGAHGASARDRGAGRGISAAQKCVSFPLEGRKTSFQSGRDCGIERLGFCIFVRPAFRIGRVPIRCAIPPAFRGIRRYFCASGAKIRYSGRFARACRVWIGTRPTLRAGPPAHLQLGLGPRAPIHAPKISPSLNAIASFTPGTWPFN